MTVHTVYLEDQGIVRPKQTLSAIWTPIDPRCEHEVVDDGLVRQCKAKPVMEVWGRNLCAIHGRMVLDGGR